MSLNKSTLMTLFSLFLLGSFTYAIKQKVIELDNDLSKIHRSIMQYQESMHILNAEWAYLTRPSRLQALVEEHTGLHQSHGTSLVNYKEIFEGESEPLEHCEPPLRLASFKRR